MAEAESEAIREQLASYLQTQLRGQFPTLEVLPSWPNGTHLPDYAILVSTAGDPDITPHFPAVISATPTSGANGLVTYQYGWAEVPLMLDAWAASKSARRDLALAIRRVTNQPQQVTLSVPGAFPVLGRKAYLTLSVTELFGALFTYCFPQVASEIDASAGAQKNEWRSSWRGVAYGPLWEQETTALVKQIQIQGYVGPGELGKAAGNQSMALNRPADQTAVIVAPAMVGVVPATPVQLKAYTIFKNSPKVDVTASAAWSTSDPMSATVSSSGLVTTMIGSPVGTQVTITATYGGFHASCTVTVE